MDTAPPKAAPPSDATHPSSRAPLPLTRVHRIAPCHLPRRLLRSPRMLGQSPRCQNMRITFHRAENKIIAPIWEPSLETKALHQRRTPQLEMTPTKAADEAGENANERAEEAAKAAAAATGEKVEKLAVEAANAARAAVQIKHHRAEERRALKGVEAAGVGGTRKVLGG